MKPLMSLVAICVLAILVYGLPSKHDAASLTKAATALNAASTESSVAVEKMKTSAQTLMPAAATGGAEMKTATADYSRAMAEARQKHDVQRERLTTIKEEVADFRKTWWTEIHKIKDQELREAEETRFARAVKRIDNNVARADAALLSFDSALEKAADIQLVALSVQNEIESDKIALKINALNADVTVASNSMSTAAALLLAGLDFQVDEKTKS